MTVLRWTDDAGVHVSDMRVSSNWGMIHGGLWIEQTYIHDDGRRRTAYCWEPLASPSSRLKTPANTA